MFLKSLYSKFIAFVCFATSCFLLSASLTTNAVATKVEYAGIWKASEGAGRNQSAVNCFNGLVGHGDTVKKITKHVLAGHLKTFVEVGANLPRALVAWLAPDIADGQQMMAQIRQLLADLYNTGNSIDIIKGWDRSSALTVNISGAFERLKSFSTGLRGIRDAINGYGDLIHTYDGEDHTPDNMGAIDAFIGFFRQVGNDILTVGNIGDLIAKQANLFGRLTKMTTRMLQDYFEPCIRAFMDRAFTLQEIPLSVGGLVPPITIDNVVCSEEATYAVTKIDRHFAAGGNFTRFVKAVLTDPMALPVNYQSAHAALLEKQDEASSKSVKLRAILKAVKMDQATAPDVDYISPDGQNRSISADPFIATFLPKA